MTKPVEPKIHHFQICPIMQFLFHPARNISVQFILFLLLATPLVAQKKAAQEYQSYLAHIAAANSAILLNRSPEARQWLETAPVKHRGWEWHFLNKYSNQSTGTYEISGEQPANFSLSPDGRSVALAMPGGSVEIRDAQSMETRLRLEGHSKAVYSVAFSPDGSSIVSVSRDSSIRAWDTGSGRQLWTASSGGHGFAVTVCSPNGSTVATASWFRDKARGVVGLIKLFDAHSGKEKWSAEFGVKPTLGLAFSSSGRYLAAGNWDGQVGVWDLQQPTKAPAILDFSDRNDYTAIDDIAFHPTNDSILAAASKCGEPRIWNTQTGKRIAELRGHRQAVMAIAFSPDGRRIYTGGDEGVLHVWNAETGNLNTQLHGHAGRVTRIRPTSDGKALLTLSDDKTIRRWTAGADAAFDAPRSSDTYVYAFAGSPDGTTLAMGAPNGQVSVWNAQAGTMKNQFPCLEEGANAVALNPDGSQLVAVNWGAKVPILDARTGAAVRTLEGVEGVSSGCAWSADGRWIAAASRRNFVFVWEAETGRLIQKINCESGTYFVQFSPDSRRLATAGNDGKILVWDMTQAEQGLVSKVSSWQAHATGSSIYSLHFSPDGKRLLSGAEDKTAHIFEFPSGKLAQTLQGHAQRIWSVAWSPDGSRVATASADLSTCLWDARTGQRTLLLLGRQPVYNLLFTPDGRLLANEMNGKVQVWEAGE